MNWTPDQLKNPERGEINPVDLIDTMTGRVWLPDGSGTGLTVSEAMVGAAHWWEHKARFTMPDHNKPNAGGTRSRILAGRPWAELNQSECLHVMWQWHTHIAVPMQIQQGLNPNKEIMQ